MGRMIDADALREEVMARIEYLTDADDIKDNIRETIDSAPTVEELTKCKDCVWWTKADDSLQGRCLMFGIYPTGAWFCANGGRK